jgi:hypothetical protein
VSRPLSVASLLALALALAACGSSGKSDRDRDRRPREEAAQTNGGNAAEPAKKAAEEAESEAAGEQGQVDATSPAVASSAQRAAIMNALRPAVERDLHGPVEFLVQRVSVRDGWALVMADPQRPGGGRIDPAEIFPEDQLEFMDGLTVSAILRFSGDSWTLVDHRIGATDVWYCDGSTGAPRALTGC